ncbi:Armadillo-type fold [Cinara cedri]|uniref:Armadillo-type fold n=1 Tax=Cinara cedri TaxID=506608 RepID=A0A5E4M9H8_9HEMI|nr:Armadillo-type fold [Cinara cedri]
MVKNKTIIKLFEKAGNVGSQPNLVRIIKAKYDAMNFDEFKILFMEALCSVFISDTPMYCSVVNNMIKFAAHSLSVLSKDNIKDEHGDKAAEVRVQAVHALHWLQLPDYKKCKIVKQFLFHMTCDPCVEVRASIAKQIVMFNVVVDKMLEYTLSDRNKSVKKEAYNRLIEYPFDRLSSQQRQIIVEYGLKDPDSIKGDKEFILMQLLDLASIFAMDDVGATSLNILCHDLILDSKTSVTQPYNLSYNL